MKRCALRFGLNWGLLAVTVLAFASVGGAADDRASLIESPNIIPTVNTLKIPLEVALAAKKTADERVEADKVKIEEATFILEGERDALKAARMRDKSGKRNEEAIREAVKKKEDAEKTLINLFAENKSAKLAQKTATKDLEIAQAANRSGGGSTVNPNDTANHDEVKPIIDPGVKFSADEKEREDKASKYGKYVLDNYRCEYTKGSVMRNKVQISNGSGCTKAAIPPEPKFSADYVCSAKVECKAKNNDGKMSISGATVSCHAGSNPTHSCPTAEHCIKDESVLPQTSVKEWDRDAPVPAPAPAPPGTQAATGQQ